MSRILGNPRVVRSVSLSYEFDSLCRKHQICLSEALRVGISLKLAELGEMDYDNNLNLYRKMCLFKNELEKTSTKLAELQEKYEQKN